MSTGVGTAEFCLDLISPFSFLPHSHISTMVYHHPSSMHNPGGRSTSRSPCIHFSLLCSPAFSSRLRSCAAAPWPLILSLNAAPTFRKHQDQRGFGHTAQWFRVCVEMFRPCLWALCSSIRRPHPGQRRFDATTYLYDTRRVSMRLPLHYTGWVWRYAIPTALHVVIAR